METKLKEEIEKILGKEYELMEIWENTIKTKLIIYDYKMKNDLILTYVLIAKREKGKILNDTLQIQAIFEYDKPFICYADYLRELGQKIQAIQNAIYNDLIKDTKE